MGRKKECLEVRVIKETKNNFEPSYKLKLTNPSDLEFTWFKINDTEHIADEQEALWKKYNPKLRETLNSFSKFIKGGAFLEEIAETLEIDYPKARTLKRSTIYEYNLLELVKVKGERTTGRWDSLPIELVAYILSYYMPIIEGWKTSEDIHEENNISVSTINNMCVELHIEAITRTKRWYISPIGEQVIVEKLRKRKETRYVVRKDDTDYYSMVYAGREAARLRGFEEGTDEFGEEAERRYKMIPYLLSHCSIVKSEKIGGSPYVDRKNLDLLCDIISKQEAAQILNLPEKEITLMMKNGALPSIPGDKTNFTSWSAVLGYVKGKKTEAKAEIESTKEYAALVETNQLLSTRLEEMTEELKQAEKYKTRAEERYSQQKQQVVIKYKEKIKTLRAQYRKSLRYKARFEESQKRAIDLTKQVDDLTKEIKGYARREADFNKNYARLETEADSLRTENEAQEAEIEQNQKVITALESQVDNLTREKQEQKAAYEQAEANLKGRYNNLEASIGLLTKQIEQQKETITQLQSEKATLAAQVIFSQGRKPSEEAASNTIADLTKQIDDLTKKLQGYVTGEEELKTQYAHLEAKVTSLLEKNKVQKETITQLQSGNKELQARVATYQAEETTRQKSTVTDKLIKELTKEKTGLIQKLEKLQALYEEQTRVLINSNEKLTEFQNRYKEEERDYLTRLWRAASAFEVALNQGGVPERNKGMDELLSYLMEATHFQGTEISSLSRYASALNAKSTTTFNLYDLREWMDKYLKNGEERYIKLITPFIFQLTEELKERIS